MALFLYKARDNSGALITGELEAETTKAVKIQLADRGLFPVSVGSKGVQLQLPRFLRKRKSIIKDLIAFTRQFATLFKSGVPMDRILAALSKQARNIQFKDVINEIKADVMGGSGLFKAFSKHPEYFDELYINMLGVGEEAGLLDQTLNELTQVLRREYRIKSAIKSATLYPKIVTVAFILVVILLTLFVIPGFADFYAGFGATLPLPTRIMIFLSDTFSAYWYFALAGAVVIFISIRKYLATDIGKNNWDRLKFRLPVFGNLNRMVANARFGHLVAALYKSGLPMKRTLAIVGNTIGNRAFKADVDNISRAVEKGSSLGTAMESSKYIEVLIVEAAAVGEQSGALDELLETTAQFYDEEVDNLLDQLTTLIEPLLLFGLFGMIALLAASVFLPMWGVSEAVLPAEVQ